ncbi:xanthine dehydrogenase small subunit [Pseudobacteriovorax antillogorgiicola]|uniref:Xanthine dehydrogenase small subunit n=1 Tax=Pseudobacteriovorax antillogorgiicola TaxID=1513793 RepID=A0A1Y6C8D2_9BACT|nr:FAD binding domain-containing protein [Pseudobacteriovorax antillogorgiicola]TCS49772.1 xanthine dehydrogenase small subunit [Pseudobacteriovorax antillogorgiicola]SMF42754.1 xanthine dehydrogenase small subunit [Pseudobacteriovorax antillogorgiicola]
MRDYILLYINGHRHEVRGDAVLLSLVDYIRQHKHLTGTKVVCAEGDCGSCSVLFARGAEADQAQGRRFKTLNSCIASVYHLDCHSLVTVEGLIEGGAPSHIQDIFAKNHGAQCGFCTPGFIASLSALCEAKKSLSEQDVRNACTGNLCRCTGYKSIIESGLALEASKIKPLADRYLSQQITDDLKARLSEPVQIKTQAQEYNKPKTLSDALAIKASEPQVRILGAGTDTGVWVNKKDWTFSKALDLQLIEELTAVKESDGCLHVGARVTLTKLEQASLKSIPELSRYLHIFASPQIKNVATLVGNIANGSPIGDTMPPLMVLGAELKIERQGAFRYVPLEDFYRGYKDFDLEEDEIITQVKIPIPKGDGFRVFKVSKRKDLDISTVSAAFLMERDGAMITSMKLALGGVADRPLRLRSTESTMQSKPWNQTTIDEAKVSMLKEIQPISDLRGSHVFRRVLSVNLLQKYFNELGAGTHG